MARWPDTCQVPPAGSADGDSKLWATVVALGVRISRGNRRTGQSRGSEASCHDWHCQLVPMESLSLYKGG